MQHQQQHQQVADLVMLTFIGQVFKGVWEEASVESLGAIPFQHHLQGLPGTQVAHALQLDLTPAQTHSFARDLPMTYP